MLNKNNLFYFNSSIFYIIYFRHFLQMLQVFNFYDNCWLASIFTNIQFNKYISDLVKLKIFYNNKPKYAVIKSNKWNVKKFFNNKFWKLRKRMLSNLLYSYNRKVLNSPKISYLKSYLLKTTNFIYYYPVFFQNWSFLIGSLISPTYWDFTLKKNNYRFLPVTKSNRNVRLFQHILNLWKKIFNNVNPKTESNVKLLSSPNNFLFNISSVVETRLKKNKSIFSRPYFFLNSSNLININSKTVIDNTTVLYNNYSSIFNLIKKHKFKFSYRQNHLSTFSQYYKIITHWKKHVNHRFLRQNEINKIDPTLMSYKKAHFFTPLKYSRIQNPHKNENKNTAMIINSFKLPLINKYLQIKKKSSLFINKNKLSKKLKIILKRYVFFTPLLESSNLVISRVNFNKKNKQILQYINKKLKPTSNYINLVKTAQCSSFFNLNNIFIRRKKNFNSKFKIKLNFKWKNSSIYNRLLKPLFFTLEKAHFTSGVTGFLYINDWTMNELLTNKIYNIKKLSYSFITKNELHKHILRKYSKIIWAGNTENMNLNSLIDTDYLSQNTNKSNFFNNTNLKYFMNSTSSHLTFLANYGLASSKWPLFKNRLSFVHSYNETTNNITIGRIRFKPGYSTQWRNARSNFKLVADLRFRYQYKLTRYLMRFLKLKYSNFFLIFEMELQNVLFRSRFVPEKNLAKSLIIFNAVYINGTLCNNLKFQLYVNDLIQLVVSLKYYILYKQIVNWSLKKKTKLRKIIISKLPSESETEDKQRSNHLSNWIFTSEGSNEDTLKYCEIDYFTLSILVIYEPFSLHEINYYNLIKYRPVTFRLYNWKYIT